MKSTLRVAALRTTRYSDTHAILQAYSREAGRLSLLLRDGSGREACRRRALLMPLSLAEVVADVRPGRDIHPLLSVAPLEPLHGVHASPVKATIALFIAEVLGLALRECAPDAAVWAFVDTTARALDTASGRDIAPFHIAFLRHLAGVLGIDPDWLTWSPEATLFNAAEGRFSSAAPAAALGTQQGCSPRLVHLLERIHYGNAAHLRLDRQGRGALTDAMLHYISLHHTPLTALHTLPVLRSL